MKILLTGTNGLVGGKILSLAQNKNIDILPTAKRSLYQKSDIFEYLDITDFARVDYLLEVYKPDVVINSAALSKVDICEKEKINCLETNYKAVVNLADSCYKRKIHLVHLSTDFVFDGKTGRYKENDQASPVNYYGEAKLKAEEYLQNSAISYSIVRTVLVYGLPVNPYGSNILTWVLKNMKENNRIRVVNDQYRTPTLVDDLAMAVLKIATEKREGIWHISGNEYMSVYEFAVKIADFFGYDRDMISPVSTAELNEFAMRPPGTGFNISKASLDLDYFPHNIEEGLAVIKSEINKD